MKIPLYNIVGQIICAEFRNLILKGKVGYYYVYSVVEHAPGEHENFITSITHMNIAPKNRICVLMKEEDL